MKMAETGKIKVECCFYLWEDLLSKLSEEGLSDLESAIKAERYRRKEIKALYPEASTEI